MLLAAGSIAHIAKLTPNCFKYFTFILFLSVLSGESLANLASAIPRHTLREMYEKYVGLRNDFIQDLTKWVKDFAD